MYCFTNWRTAKDGFEGLEPDFPDGISCLMAMDPGKCESTWCLCEVFFDDKFDEDSVAFERVYDELELLLDSAKGYPPAIAISFHNANAKWPISKSEYSQLLIELLKQNLRNQEIDGFILAEAIVEDPVYLCKGEFVWLVGFYPETDEVLWVSDDYYLYRNPVSNFKIKTEQLKKITVNGA